jgi:hypothetical protein
MEAPRGTNPLRLVAILSVVFLVMDALKLFSHHPISVVGYTRMALAIALLILYVLRSYFAWHAAVAVGPVILIVYLFLYFTGGHIYRPLHHAREVMIIWTVGEIVALTVVLVYLFRLRQPYRDYVSESHDQSI